MKKNIFSVLFFYSFFSFGQQEIVAAGGDATGTGGTVSYSIGQVAFQSFSGVSGSVSQGVQQNFITVTLANNTFTYSFSATLFPNPTTDTAVLSLENLESNATLNYILTNLQGKLITKGTISNKQTTIDVATLADACYILNVFENNKPIKTFKLLKHN
jgi:Secretion system C-terminal sorting domain